MRTARRKGITRPGREQRASFRINDRIALHVRPLEDADYRHAIAHPPNTQHRQRTLNSILNGADQNRGTLRKISDYDPAVASYLQNLESRIESLARLLTLDLSNAPDTPTHEVNISGNGLYFQHSQPLAEKSHLSLDIQLFPSHTCLNLLATVVRCVTVAPTAKGDERFSIAVDYCHIHEDDRDLIIHHIHSLQLKRVRRDAGLD